MPIYASGIAQPRVLVGLDCDLACAKAGLGTRITDSNGKLIKSVAHRIPHDFRRTAVRNLERAGVPRSAAMELVGHKTMSIYSRYAICDESMLKDAGVKLEQLHAIDQHKKTTKVMTK